VPAGDVELKIGIRRMDNTILPAGEEPTYTTDSDGVATVEFNKINMPGDSHGNLIFMLLSAIMTSWAICPLIKHCPGVFHSKTTTTPSASAHFGPPVSKHRTGFSFWRIQFQSGYGALSSIWFFNW